MGSLVILILFSPSYSITPDLPITEPTLEWVSCSANEATLGLSDSDFMKLQMYLASLRGREYHRAPDY